MVEHPLAQVCRDPHGRAEEADAPQKAPDDHQDHDPDHGPADVLQQHLFGESQRLAAHHHLPQVHAVDDQAVQLRDEQLDVVHRQQRQNAQQQHRRVLEIVSVDRFAEITAILLLSYSCFEQSTTNAVKYKYILPAQVRQWDTKKRPAIKLIVFPLLCRLFQNQDIFPQLIFMGGGIFHLP